MVAESQVPFQTRLFTVEDYDQLPDDGPRYELIDGVLFEMPAPTIFHQSVLSEYNDLIKQHVRQHRLGLTLFSPVDVELTRLDIVQPDLVFVSNVNSRVMGPDGKRIVGAPDLVVEASSPRTTLRDQGAKRRLYASHRIPEYWFVDTRAQTQVIWSLVDDNYQEIAPVDGVLHSVVLPGLRIDVPALMDLARQALPSTNVSEED